MLSEVAGSNPSSSGGGGGIILQALHEQMVAASAAVRTIAGGGGGGSGSDGGGGDHQQPFIDSFCRPQFNASSPWASITNELGAFTPCFLDIVVLGTAYVTLAVLSLLRISWLKASSPQPAAAAAAAAAAEAAAAAAAGGQDTAGHAASSSADASGPAAAGGAAGGTMCSRSRGVQIAAAVLALLCAIIPLMQLSARISLNTFVKTQSLPPSEIISLVLCASAWFLTAAALYRESKPQVWQHRGWWMLRFGIIFVVVGQLAKLRFVLMLQDNFEEFFVELFFFYTSFHVLLGLFALFFYPTLTQSGPATSATDAGVAADKAPPAGTASAAEYEALPAGPEEEQICPERKSGFLSFLTFGWMSPLMTLGFKRPLQESDVWQLDQSDRSRTIFNKFNHIWAEERSKMPQPWLLRCLHRAFGRQFWWGGFCKIGNDASQFVGPLMLKSLLKAMQVGEPAWHGFVYAVIIFLGQVMGVLCEAQYFQSVMRVGFHVRQALVAAVFHKALRLTRASRATFGTGRVTSMMTTDAEALQMVCQQLHNLWSAPLRILLCMALLFQQLGVASLVGFAALLLMIPLQAVIVNRVQKLVKASLSRADQRVELMNEILSSMDVVKCYVWEESFKSKVLGVRNEELGLIRTSQYIMAINFFLLNIVPVLVTVLAFGTFSFLGGDLTPSKAFTSISLFSVLRFPLYTFPQLITQVVNVNVSLKRLQEMLLAEELPLDAQHSPTAAAAAASAEESKGSDDSPPLLAVHIPGSSFSWTAGGAGGAADGAADVAAAAATADEKPLLSGIRLEVEQGKLVAIVGGTGQGKSSLLAACLGEMPVAPGGGDPPTVRGTKGYIPQTAWIFNATVRENILFGLPFDREKYEQAVRVSALERDLELLPGGDLTEIGERGVNVSGGQKQRISIARAVYSDADVYFFDDPLSALDSHVGKQVFETCMKKALSGKTRIMVTNQIHFLPEVDWVVLVDDGKIAEQGSYEELLASGQKFQQLMKQAGSVEDSVEEPETGSGQENGKDSAETDGAEKAKLEKEEGKEGGGKKTGGEGEGKGGTKLVQKEERETGMVSRAVIGRYVRAMGGGGGLVLLLVLYGAIELSRLWSSVWITIWTGSEGGKGGGDGGRGSGFYIAVYAAICLLQVLLTFCNQFWLTFCSQKAARSLHEAMLSAVLRAPMVFFHANPVGRLINRFTKDTSDIDKSLAQFTSLCLGGIFQLISTFALIGALNPLALWAVVPLLALFYVVYLYFQTTAREVKRLDSITRSPVYSQFAEALTGLATIRAFGAMERVAAQNGEAMDRNVRFTLVNMGANRWLAIRLEALGGLMIFATAVFAVLDVQRAGDQAAHAPTMGLILSYALTITAMMTMVLRLASVAENSFNAVERVGSFADLPGEAPAVVAEHRPPPGWPQEGEVLFDSVVMRYRPDLPPILTGLTVDVRGGEKVGVVGRTGAGKSTLFNSLFRLTEIESGRISIDGVDIRPIGLADVRHALMIIPQTPVLFTGSIRFNLDPFGDFDDSLVWEALERSHLKPVVQRLPLGLNAEVSEGGDNFSVGQRQLISLARALLRRAKILVLDEATAAVDIGTDALIQRTIRDEFGGCTMLTIAHRLNTIIDSDRVLVMDAGQAIEYDTPANLVRNEQSAFAGMVRSTGAANAKFLQRAAFGEVSIGQELADMAEKQLERQQVAQQESAKWQWATSAQWAMATRLTSSQKDLQSICSTSQSLIASEADPPAVDQESVLEEVRDAAFVLQAVLSGQRRDDIRLALQQRGVSEQRWWSALTRVVQGLAVMGEAVQAQFDTTGSLLESRAGRSSGVWNQLALTGEETQGGD